MGAKLSTEYTGISNSELKEINKDQINPLLRANMADTRHLNSKIAETFIRGQDVLFLKPSAKHIETLTHEFLDSSKTTMSFKYRPLTSIAGCRVAMRRVFMSIDLNELVEFKCYIVNAHGDGKMLLAKGDAGDLRLWNACHDSSSELLRLPIKTGYLPDEIFMEFVVTLKSQVKVDMYVDAITEYIGEKVEKWILGLCLFPEFFRVSSNMTRLKWEAGSGGSLAFIVVETRSPLTKLALVCKTTAGEMQELISCPAIIAKHDAQRKIKGSAETAYALILDQSSFFGDKFRDRMTNGGSLNLMGLNKGEELYLLLEGVDLAFETRAMACFWQ
jgi:hypothetical protein